VLGGAFILGFFLQVGTLCVRCRCWESAWESSQCGAAAVFDGLVIARVIASLIFRERNQKWIAYSVMCVASPWWIGWIFEVMRALLGPHYGV
jgi:hypothetical protein